MHLLIALKCPSSRSLFCLGFYLESCYNLCRAIRFLSSGCGRIGSSEQGKEPGVSRGKRDSGSGMCPTHPRQPGFIPTPRLKQPKIMEQKKDKTGGGKNPGFDGNGAHSPAGLARREGGAGPGLQRILQLLLRNRVLASASPHSWGNIWLQQGTRGTLRGRDGCAGAARQGCQQSLCAAPQPCRKLSQLYFPACSRMSPADKPNTEHNMLPGNICLKSCGNGIQQSLRPTGSFFAQPNP